MITSARFIFDLVVKHVGIVPHKLRSELPVPLRQQYLFSEAFVDSERLLVSFERKATKKHHLWERDFNEVFVKYPFLIKGKDDRGGTAFKIINAYRTSIIGCSVSGLNALDLGPNSTILLQGLRVRNPRVKDYVVELAYAVGFGAAVLKDTASPFLESLIEGSFRQWLQKALPEEGRNDESVD